MSARARRPHAVRRVVTVVAALVAAVAVCAVAGLPVYVFPATDDARGVDAVLVLGPPGEDRFAVAEQVSADNGGIPIVISAPASGVDSVPRLTICRETGVVCRTPDPFTTLGEGIILRDLATANGWRRVAVVTSTPHITRARMILGECYAGEIRMVSSGTGDVGVGVDWWAAQYVYQTAGFVKALFTRC